ncbi:MAG: 50S ribosomal protein L14e [Candidatus Odinarchaeota archaeon]|nr:50S ribosomal protein L14e [Candidatus Thorarchaeota archaeon]
MNLYDIGRICVKVVGRETGSHCVIVEIKDDSYVVITGPKNLSGVRRRNCNTRHLEPLETVLPISKGADDEAVRKAIDDAGLTDKFRQKIRFEL